MVQCLVWSFLMKFSIKDSMKEQETVSITVNKYFDNKGRPTCSNSLENNCKFLLSRKWEFEYSCFFSPSTESYLERYEELSCLKPCFNCVVHKIK